MKELILSQISPKERQAILLALSQLANFQQVNYGVKQKFLCEISAQLELPLSEILLQEIDIEAIFAQMKDSRIRQQVVHYLYQMDDLDADITPPIEKAHFMHNLLTALDK